MLTPIFAAPTTPTSQEDFIDICATEGQQARCCALPIVSRMRLHMNSKHVELTHLPAWSSSAVRFAPGLIDSEAEYSNLESTREAGPLLWLLDRPEKHVLKE